MHLPHKRVYLQCIVPKLFQKMATFKAIVEPHYKRADGTYNIRIRVTHNRKSKLLSTQLYATAEDLTRKLKIKNEAFIDATNDLIKTYRDACNQIGERLSVMTVEQVVDVVRKHTNSSTAFYLDFIEFGRSVANNMIAEGRVGSAKNYIIALNSLMRFVGREKVGIHEITAKFLQTYVVWLNALPAKANREKGERAASLYLSYIRALHNKAKNEYNDEDTGIIRIPFSPFTKFKLPRAPQTRKRALTIEQIQQIIDLPYKLRSGCEPEEYCRFNLAKDMFILSFALIGMNSVDLYNCTDYKDGFITYQRTKTKNRRQDKAEITIEVQPQILPLFEKYRDKSDERVFDFHHHYSTAVGFNSNINKLLKTIGAELKIDDLEFYAARHSWATIALNDVEANKYVVHTALNHIDEAMRVTDIYIKKDFTIINQTNAEVLKKFDFTSFSEKEPIK